LRTAQDSARANRHTPKEKIRELANEYDHQYATSGDVTMVDISGRIALGSAALRGLMHDLLISEHKKILINLGKVDYIDSSGLGHLIGAFTSARKGGGALKLLNPKKNVHDLMQITKLNTIFEIMDDEKVAIRSFDKSVAVSR
jgi:anti-sigma B factor antagonist